MTSEKIIDLAKFAAECAFDAHEQMGEMPSALIAYSFVVQLAWDDPNNTDMLTLTHREFKLFSAEYNMQMSLIIASHASLTLS